MKRERTGWTYLLAIGHRAFFAGSNLLLTVRAGQALDAPEFGQFALFIATVSLLLIPHTSFFSEPMLVYGPKDYAKSLRRYLITLGEGQLCFGLVSAAASVGAGLWTGQSGYFAFALALPLALTLDFQVRCFFMQLCPLAALGSAMVQFGVLALVLFAGTGLFSETIAGFLSVYVLSLLAANGFLLTLHLRKLPSLGRDAINLAEMARRHARFAAWTLVAHLMLFLVTNSYIFVLPLLQDLTTTANFRAQSAITGPGVQAFSALGMMAVPMLRISSSQADFLYKLRKLLLIITAVGLPFVILAGLFGKVVINLIYSGKYGLDPIGYWLAGLYPLAIGYAFMMGSALRAIDRAHLVVVSAGIAAAVSLPIGLWLTWKFGAEGVILAQVLGALTIAAGAAAVLWRYFKSSQEKAF